MDLDQVKDQQDQILKIIYETPSEPEKLPVDGVLNYIHKLPHSDIVFIFGDLGHKIKSFADSIDLDHPDLTNFCEGQLSGKQQETFSKIALDLISLFLFCRNNDISSSVLEALKQIICKHSIFSKIETCIDSPLENQLHVRFVKYKDYREKIRSTKKCQKIKLNTHLIGSKENWKNYPNNLFEYSRHNNIFQKQIKEADIKRKTFLDHGLTFMAQEIEKDIIKIKSQIDLSRYIGFNKISITYVAIVLAKMCGFDAEENTMDSSLFLYEENKKISLNAQIYSIQELRDRCPENILNLIKYLENFPQLNNKPLFDHYRVVLPCWDYPSSDQKIPFSLADSSGKFLEFFDLFEAQKFYNLELVKKNKIVGALLGERDGEHFFISYFL